MTYRPHARAGRGVLSGVLGGAALVSACYTYVPVRDGFGGRTGDEVEVYLSDTGAGRVAPQLGPRVSQLAGRLTAGGDSNVVVAVSELTRGGQRSESWGGDTVRISASDVRQLARRRLAPVATVGAVVVATAGVVLGGRSLGGSNGGTKVTGGSVSK